MKASAGKVAITTEKLHANDSLFAKILLLCEADVTVAVISLDYISLGGDIGTLSDGFYPALRRGLAELGITDVLCGTTHTHTPEPMIVPEDEVLTKYFEYTCSNADICITDEGRIFATYSDFTRTDAEGNLAKSILVSEIAIEDAED